ncbi:hypothetical protein CKO51_03560 [Rhodopirellula sp. SM50]|nr:Hpt domain-containing protein [Rhodopirellula sp. SM50]PAY20963.1 hypothetical protein CKO51_03560 [Rhodopirellula sp. SM50]
MPKFDARIPIRTRLTLTLVCLLTATVLLADWIGLIPDSRTQLARGRVSVCESLAAAGTAMVAAGNSKGFESAVTALVERNRSLRSARLIDSDGNTAFQTAGHAQYWSPLPQHRDSNFTLPIFRFGKPWGNLQLAFTAPATELAGSRFGIWGLLAFLIPISLLQYSWLLETMLPSPAATADPAVADPATADRESLPADSDGAGVPQSPPTAAAVVPGVLALNNNTLSDDTLKDYRSADDTLRDVAPAAHTPEASPSESCAPSGPPIHTTLPIDDEEMRCIVVNFVDRLDARLNGMQDALNHADFQTLRSEAHWLKGSGGTVGFGDFTIPAKELEHAAKDQDSQLALDLLQQIHSIRSRIVPPAPPSDQPSAPQPPSTDNAPIKCTLPLDDEDYLDIVVDFLQQLDLRLMGMLSMVQTKSFDELHDEAHWLKGSGGTVGFPAFTDPALALMNASERRDVRQCQESLRDVLAIRQRLVVPHTANPAPAESLDAR